MDLIKILKAHNIEGEAAEAIETAIKKDIHTSFIPKTQYNKKVQELDAVKTELDDNKARAEAPNEYEAKYNDVLKELEGLKNDYDTYKNEIATKETRSAIDNKVTKALNANGFTNNKVVELMLKNLDYDALSIEGEEVQGFDLNAFTKGFEDFRTVSNTEGTQAFNPPTQEASDDPWLAGYTI